MPRVRALSCAYLCLVLLRLFARTLVPSVRSLFVRCSFAVRSLFVRVFIRRFVRLFVPLSQPFKEFYMKKNIMIVAALVVGLAAAFAFSQQAAPSLSP